MSEQVSRSSVSTPLPQSWEVWVCPKHGILPDDGDFIEGQDPSRATASDPDGWTGVLYCGQPVGYEACCEEVERIVVVPR